MFFVPHAMGPNLIPKLINYVHSAMMAPKLSFSLELKSDKESGKGKE